MSGPAPRHTRQNSVDERLYTTKDLEAVLKKKRGTPKIDEESEETFHTPRKLNSPTTFISPKNETPQSGPQQSTTTSNTHTANQQPTQDLDETDRQSNTSTDSSTSHTANEPPKPPPKSNENHTDSESNSNDNMSEICYKDIKDSKVRRGPKRSG